VSRKTKLSSLLVGQIERSDLDSEILAVIDQQAKTDGVRHWLGLGVVTGTYYAFPMVGRKPVRRQMEHAERFELSRLPGVGSVQ
jgi:hypothetical protein